MSDVMEAGWVADARNDDQCLADVILSNATDGLELTYQISELLLQSRFEAAFLIAQRLIAIDTVHPAIFLAQAIGGLVMGDAAAESAGRAALHRQMSANSHQQQTGFYRMLVEPVVPILLERSFYGGDPAKTLRVLDIVTAAMPELEAVFDLSAPAKKLDLGAMRRRGADRAHLIIMPPPPSRRRNLRAVVAMRELVFPQQPYSRPHEVGPRIAASMEAYGWTPLANPMLCAHSASDYAAITAFCERERPDLLLLDDQLIEAPYARAARADMLQKLRQSLPRLQVVGVYLDAWSLPSSLLLEAAEGVDVVWSITPSQKIWRDFSVWGKIIHPPFPPAATHNEPLRPLIPRMFFSGAVKGYNWHRAFWLTAAQEHGLPLDARLAHHGADGLSALDSSRIYMRELSEATCAVNFSMRPDLSRIATGRSFETCLSGSLLIQETSPDLDYYFVAGEHYLEFSSFSQLRSIADFLATEPAQAEAVRKRGCDYARAHYDDTSVIATLDRRLRMNPRG